MVFSSPAFFVFFAVFFPLYVLAPARHRLSVIIAGSTVFYAWWKVSYTWLPYLLMAIAYGGAQWMERGGSDVARRRRAAATVAALFVPLIVFKYANFLYADVAGPLFGWRGRLVDVSLPLGVSFITFTLTAFVVDIYKRRFSAKHDASTVLGYVLFFPHLIAGPILRPRELIPQLERPGAARRRPAVAVAIFTIGLMKKLVFADPIGEGVDAIYRAAHASAAPITAPAALLAIYGFSAQIYCDFSGYTDMAIGLALLLGVRLPNNFLRPYSATSLVEFWRRWHITLSYWLRDYLYIPLGGSRGGRVAEVRNVIVTMTLGGLWHGANWTFVIWGVLHGIGVAVVHAFSRVFRWPLRPGDSDRLSARRGRMPAWIGLVLTFHVVTVLWIFFRAPSVGDAAHLLRAVFAGGWSDAPAVLSANLFMTLLVAVCLLLHRFDDHRRIRAAVRYVRPELRWPALAALWLIAIAVSQGSSAKFIYFDF